MLRNIIHRLFVLALFCVPHAQIRALDNGSPEKSAIAEDGAITRSDLSAAEAIPGPRISRCDENTGFIRLRGVPFCELDRYDGGEIVREPSKIKYRVLVEKGLDRHAGEFAENIAAVLDSSSGWKQAGLSFARVREGQDITIVLAQPRAVDRLCRPLRTEGQLSCATSGQVVINMERWLGGAQPWGDDIAGYRYYLINHEVGHLLGISHAKCPGKGQPAPIMLQQTIGLDTCIANGSVTAIDLAMLRPYLSILQRRLSNSNANRLKQRPVLIARKRPPRRREQNKHVWVAPQPPGYALAFKITADD